MKKILLVSTTLLCLFSSHSFAQTKGKLSFDHVTSNDSITLHVEKFEPVIKKEPYETICKDEIKKTQNICEEKWRDGSSVEGPGGWYESCTTRTIYETKEYACTKYHDIEVGKKLVKKITHHVIGKVLNAELTENVLIVDIDTDQTTVKAASAYSHHLITSTPKTSLLSSSIENDIIIEEFNTILDITIGRAASELRKFKDAAIKSSKVTKEGIAFQLSGVEGLENMLLINHSIYAKNVWRYSWHHFAAYTFTDFSKIAVKTPNSYEVKLPIKGMKKSMVFDGSFNVILIFPANTLNANVFKNEFKTELKEQLDDVRID